MFTVPPHMEWGVTRPPPHPPSPKPPASPTTSTGGGIHRHMHKHIHIHTVYISSSTFTHTTYVYTHVYIYIRICIISLHTHIGTIIISGGRGGPPDTGPYIFTYTEWIMMHHIIYVIYIYIYQTIPCSSTKTAMQHNITGYIQTSPYPLSSMLKLFELELLAFFINWRACDSKSGSQLWS